MSGGFYSSYLVVLAFSPSIAAGQAIMQVDAHERTTEHPLDRVSTTAMKFDKPHPPDHSVSWLSCFKPYLRPRHAGEVKQLAGGVPVGAMVTVRQLGSARRRLTVINRRRAHTGPHGRVNFPAPNRALCDRVEAFRSLPVVEHRKTRELPELSLPSSPNPFTLRFHVTEPSKLRV